MTKFTILHSAWIPLKRSTRAIQRTTLKRMAKLQSFSSTKMISRYFLSHRPQLSGGRKAMMKIQNNRWKNYRQTAIRVHLAKLCHQRRFSAGNFSSFFFFFAIPSIHSFKWSIKLKIIKFSVLDEYFERIFSSGMESGADSVDGWIHFRPLSSIM